MSKKIEIQNEGIFLYNIDSKTIYSNPFMKNGYIINSTNNSLFYFFYSRILWCFALLIALAVYSKNIYLIFLLPLGLFIITSLLFYLIFLPKQNKIINFKKPKKEKITQILVNEYSLARLICLFILCLFLTFLVFINESVRNYDIVTKGLYYVIGTAAGAFTIILMFCIIKKL